MEDVPRGACAGDWGDDRLAELGDADLVEPGGEFLGGDALLCGLWEETGVLVLVVGEGAREQSEIGVVVAIVETEGVLGPALEAGPARPKPGVVIVLGPLLGVLLDGLEVLTNEIGDVLDVGLSDDVADGVADEIKAPAGVLEAFCGESETVLDLEIGKIALEGEKEKVRIRR